MFPIPVLPLHLLYKLFPYIEYKYLGEGGPQRKMFNQNVTVAAIKCAAQKYCGFFIDAS